MLKKPPLAFSNSPPTGFNRDGFCRTGPEDRGNHAVAGTVTDDFLSISASQGNNLRTVGFKQGSKWCLCTSRWKEALDAYRDGKISREAVPTVHLHAAEQSALNEVKFQELKEFAAEAEASNGFFRPVSSSDMPSSSIREV